VANLTLQAQSPLRGYEHRFGNTSLAELSDTSIYSIGLALESGQALSSIKSNLDLDWPEPGRTTQSGDGKFTALGLQSDQVFVLMAETASADGQAAKLPALDDSAYITDQSDSDRLTPIGIRTGQRNQNNHGASRCDYCMPSRESVFAAITIIISTIVLARC